MINYKNEQRITFRECLKHPWFQKAADKPINAASITKLKEYKYQSKLKDAAMTQLVKQICPEKTKDLREQFETMDIDGNGLLDFDEMKAAVKGMGNLQMSVEEIN